jgi:O-antigen/teichoic acid export membrane protein
MLIDGIIPLIGAGIYLHKKNRLLIPCVMFCAVLNIVLNVILIPSMGILAAAVATLICYIVLAGLAWWIGSSRFSVRFPYLDLCKFVVLSGIMYFVVCEVKTSNLVLELVLRILTGAVVYGLLVIAFDREARELLFAFKARLMASRP